jgi:REP element-mobilizing transposase RayT
MPQSLSRVLLHVVFSTKERRELIPAEVAPSLHAYLAGACRALGSEAYRVGGTKDHVHIACSLPRTLTVSKLLEEIKKTSSAWLKEQDARCQGFAWQAGDGAFSLGQSQLGALLQYIDGQAEHHRQKTFKAELVEILERYGVETYPGLRPVAPRRALAEEDMKPAG